MHSPSRSSKTFVLDTNVLIHDPESLMQFEGAKVVLPLAVIEELDAFKRLNDDRGYSVRQVTRRLDRLRTLGKLSKGVPLEHGGTFVIEYRRAEKLPPQFERSTARKDHEILATAIYLKEQGEQVVFISKDINLRIKAEVLGLETEDYEREKAPINGLFKGWRETKVPQAWVDKLFKEHRLPDSSDLPDLQPNEFVILRSEANPSSSGLARYKPSQGLIPLQTQYKAWGMKPLNVQQRFALDLLLDKDISLVTLIGVPGSGKTLLALAAGLEQVFESDLYRRLLISRPIIPVGRDLGFLPGTKEEKMGTWMGAVKDNIEFLCDASGQGDEEGLTGVADIFESDKIEVEAVSFLRGRSLPRMYIVIDDAQNLTPHEIKTIISRAGEGAKVVLTGDPYQIDNPYLDAASNGLSNLVERFKGQKIAGTVKFDKIERSGLAALASELL